jgi:hypothetical protein
MPHALTQAHLRAAIYAHLKGHGCSSAAPAAGWQPLPSQDRAPSLQQHVLNCLLAEHLLAQQYRYTLSVFLAESGSGTLPRLEHADILRLVGMLPESKVHALLSCGGRATSGAGGSHGEPGGVPEDPHQAPASLAEAMLSALGRLGGHVSTAAAGCQTDACGSDGSGCGAPGPLPSRQLLDRLQQVENEWRRKSSAAEKTAVLALEERMAAYQRECEARCAAQLREQLAALREGELAEVQRREAARHQQQLEAERAALQAAHQERLAELHRREEEVVERRRQAARELDQAADEHLRRMRAEQDQLAAWKAEREAKLAAAEAAAGLAQRQAEEAERRALAQQREGEARLAEIQTKEAEVARRQAKADAELEHGAGLQRQLAAATEQLGGLQQQLRAAQTAHQAAQAEAQLEMEGLRRDKQGLLARAAAAAAGPGLTPDDAARLQQAVRRLMRRVEELQAEVASGRERERLWRSAAADAGRALEKVRRRSRSAGAPRRSGCLGVLALRHLSCPQR